MTSEGKTKISMTIRTKSVNGRLQRLVERVPGQQVVQQQQQQQEPTCKDIEPKVKNQLEKDELFSRENLAKIASRPDYHHTSKIFHIGSESPPSEASTSSPMPASPTSSRSESSNINSSTIEEPEPSTSKAKPTLVPRVVEARTLLKRAQNRQALPLGTVTASSNATVSMPIVFNGGILGESTITAIANINFQVSLDLNEIVKLAEIKDQEEKIERLRELLLQSKKTNCDIKLCS